MRFNQGYGKLPSGKYFESSEFTLMFMIKSLSEKRDASILESRNNDRDKILLVLKKNELGVWIDDSLIVSSEIDEYRWTHVTIKSEDGEVKIFRNSVEIDSKLASFSHVERSDNFIGCLTIENLCQQNLKSILDELKIFNRALSNEEIQNEMNVKQPYDILKIN